MKILTNRNHQFQNTQIQLTLHQNQQQMYPPRKSNDLQPKRTAGATASNTSPAHKDINKVNRILQNAKKYEQTKDFNKRDYMLQGIKSMNKKSNDDSNNGKKRRESQISSKSSEKGEDIKRDVYRRVDDVDIVDKDRSSQRNISYKEAQISQREIKRATGNYRSTDNLQNFQAQSYRNQGQMIRESDRNPTAYSSSENTQNANIYSRQTYQEEASISKQVPKNYIENSGKYQTGNLQYKSSTGQTSPTSVSLAQKNGFGLNQQNVQQYSGYQYSNQVQNTNQIQRVQTQSQGQSSQVIQSSVRQVKAQQNSTTKQPQSQPSTQTQFQQQQPKIQQSTTYNYNNAEQQKLNRVTSQPQFQQKTNQINTLARSTSNTALPQSQDLQQRFAAQALQQYNTAQSPEQKQQLAVKNYKDQTYLKKLQSGEMENEQKNFIKLQMDKLTQQAVEMRNKYFRSEEERVVLSEKVKFLEKDSGQLRSQNQQLKFKVKNMEFELNSLQGFKSMADVQMQQIKSSKQAIYSDMMTKINQLNNELRKKSQQLTKLERENSQLQTIASEKTYQVTRLTQLSNRKQQQFLSLQQKQYQYNKLNNAQNRSEHQLKAFQDKLMQVQTQNQKLKQQLTNFNKLQIQLSKYKKQIQDMIADMKDMEGQMEAKEKVIQEYRVVQGKGHDDVKVKMVEQELQAIMRQKAELMKSYEQKLLEKDRRISQLQIEKSEMIANKQQPKLGGLQAGQATFQQILRQQTQQINSLKQTGSQKITQVFSLKVQLQNLRSQLQNQQNKTKILSMQLQSNQRNLQGIAESHVRAAKNEVQSLNRRIQILNHTIEAKKKQNQNKDQFIKQFLLGQAGQVGQKDITGLIGQLERVLNK